MPQLEQLEQLEQFVVDAIKTESRIDSVKVNDAFLRNTIFTMIKAGNILDQIKKNVFYDKPFNRDDLLQLVYDLNHYALDLHAIIADDKMNNKHKEEVNPRLFHSIVGIATESTELLEALAHNGLMGKPMDNVNIGEEFGDLDWYKAIGCDELNIQWGTILDTVITKLKARYPDNFTSEDAINRDLGKEREILNTMETK